MEDLKIKVDGLRDLLLGKGLRTVIIPHISPDGDAVGSCSALSQVLEQAGHSWHILTCDYIPDYLKFLKNIPDAISLQDRPEECRSLLEEADLIFMLDHNNTGREGDLGPLVEESPARRVMIDHHPQPDPQTWVFSETSACSTCELLYLFIEEVWGREAVTAGVADALYTGINTDTGGLSYNSSRPQTYRIVAALLESGLDKTFIHEKIYQMNNLSRLRLLGNTLLNKLKVGPDHPLAVMTISHRELEEFGYRDGDLEGVVNIPLSVQDIAVSVQIVERKEKVKLSFRSKGSLPVNEWAKTWFDGGGHVNAAGGSSSLPLGEVEKRVLETASWFFGKYGR